MIVRDHLIFLQTTKADFNLIKKGFNSAMFYNFIQSAIRFKKQHMKKCPHCQHTLNPFKLSFAAFPLYFKCENCNIRLRLKRVKLFWLAYLFYSMMILPITLYTPFIVHNNLGVPVIIIGAFVLYYFVANHLLKKDNMTS